MLCCSERSSQRRWEFLQTLIFWVCQCAFMQWGKKRWGTMPYNFQQHYFFLSELTVKNFHLLKFLSCLFSWTTTAATHLLPRWGSVLRPQEEKVDCERSSISFLPFCLPPFLSFPLPFFPFFPSSLSSLPSLPPTLSFQLLLLCEYLLFRISPACWSSTWYSTTPSRHFSVAFGPVSDSISSSGASELGHWL